MKVINLVIGLTPYHALFAERLIEYLDGEIYCLFTKSWPMNSGKYKRVGIFCRSNVALRAITYFLSFIYFVLFVRVLFARKCILNIFIPHPASIFTNFLFFSNRVARINIYEDGLLNYCDVPVRDEIQPAGILRVLASAAGAPYRRYSGHLAGYDAGRNIDTLFVSIKDAVIGKEKVNRIVELRALKQNVNIIKKRILFLDQRTSFHLSDEQRQAMLCRMFILFPGDEYEYHYKPHHDFRSDASGMKIVPARQQEMPAELVVGELRPETVISFYSSALVNIASVFPAIRCVSLGSDLVRVTRDGRPCAITEIFTSVGVQCENFNSTDAI